jgi:hypothetical protein
MSELSKRDTFLIQMYQQMWNNINRHILVVWQSVGVLGGAFAVSALVEKQILSFNWAATVLILAAAWQFAHAIDANNWYNRNIAIISNIEREFLSPEDAAKIHPYFGQHRQPKMVDHLRIQSYLGGAVGVLVLVYHFAVEVVPGLRSPWSAFDWHKSVPYFTFIACSVSIWKFYRSKQRQYHGDFDQP